MSDSDHESVGLRMRHTLILKEQKKRILEVKKRSLEVKERILEVKERSLEVKERMK